MHLNSQKVVHLIKKRVRKREREREREKERERKREIVSICKIYHIFGHVLNNLILFLKKIGR
jgi:hypothetical protein